MGVTQRLPVQRHFSRDWGILRTTTYCQQDSEAEHPHYEKAVRNGKVLLGVSTADQMVDTAAEILARLNDAGMTPVITHPERNALLRQRIDKMAEWVAGGACVQVTGQSLLSRFGSKAEDFSRTLLDRGLVHFVASDAHDCEHRPPRLDLAHSWLTAKYGRERADALCIHNPRATLTGESLPVVEMEQGEPRKWYQIWR